MRLFLIFILVVISFSSFSQQKCADVEIKTGDIIENPGRIDRIQPLTSGNTAVFFNDKSILLVNNDLTVSKTVTIDCDKILDVLYLENKLYIFKVNKIKKFYELSVDVLNNSLSVIESRNRFTNRSTSNGEHDCIMSRYFYFINHSPDYSKILITSRPQSYNNKKPSYKATVIDKGLNVLYVDSAEYETASNLDYNNALIDNSGNIFFFYNAQRYYIDTARMGTVSYIHTNMSTHKSQELTINIFEKIENSSPNRTNCHISDYSVALRDSATIIVSGVFKSENAHVRSSLFFVTINTNDNSYNISINPFTEEMFGENAASLPALKTRPLIYIDPIYLNNGEIISICEEYWNDDGGPNSSAILTFSGNLYVTKFDKFGNVTWQQKIDKRLKSSSWIDEQAFSYAIRNGKLYIVFVDNINNFSGNGCQESIVNAALKSYDYKVLSIISMDLKSGEYQKFMLTDFTNINRADFIDKGIQISDDELLIPLFSQGAKKIEFMKAIFF